MHDLFVRSYQYQGFNVNIFIDDISETPNEWDDAILVYNHSQFYIGPEQFSVKDIVSYYTLQKQYEDANFDLKSEFKRLEHQDCDESSPELTDAEEERLEDLSNLFDYRQDYGNYYVFPVFAYIHSGVALSLSKDRYPFTDRWDVSCAGFILIPNTIVADSWEQAYTIASHRINDWNMLLSGEVFMYEIWDANENLVDTLSNIYGEDELHSEAFNSINEEIESRKQKHFKSLKKQIKAGAPLDYRVDFDRDL
jgi:hypothetical protein